MRKFLSKEQYQNKVGEWEISIDYDTAPDNAMHAEIAFFDIVGPNEESFCHEFQFSTKAIKSDKHQYQNLDDRLKYAHGHVKNSINRQQYSDLLFKVRANRTIVTSH